LDFFTAIFTALQVWLHGCRHHVLYIIRRCCLLTQAPSVLLCMLSCCDPACIYQLAAHVFNLHVYLSLPYCLAGGSRTARLRAGCAKERAPCSIHTRGRRVQLSDAASHSHAHFCLLLSATADCSWNTSTMRRQPASAQTASLQQVHCVVSRPAHLRYDWLAAERPLTA
jgi:hypothetical protein